MTGQPVDREVSDARRSWIEQRFGSWNPVWERAVRRRPEYIDAAKKLDSVAGRASVLDAKTRSFVRLALEASVTHLRRDGIRSASMECLKAHATLDEVFEVLMVTTTVSVHGMNADILADVLAERGDDVQSGSLTSRQQRIRDDYIAIRGYWRDFLNSTLALAPDFLDAYLDHSGAPWRHGVLEPKVREFIYLAFDTSPTHLHEVGMRVHMNNALDHGATPEEIVEVMSLAAVMGLQTLEVAVPILADVWPSGGDEID